MFRASVACVAIVVAAASAFAAPIPREEQRPPVLLAGSVWEGDGVVARTVYTFHEDGRLTLAYNGTTHANCGTWRQNGNTVYWETNKKYCEFEGTLKGNVLTGKSWNQPGGKWELTVRRKPTPAE